MFAKLRRWLDSVPVSDPSKSIIEIAIDRIKQINPYAFRNVQSSDLSVFMLKVSYSSIQVYSDELKKATFLLKNGEILYKSNYTKDVFTRSIGDFFLSERREYLDEFEEIEKFLQYAETFLKTYKEVSEKIDSDITDQHNIRVLRFILQNLIAVIERFCLLR